MILDRLTYSKLFPTGAYSNERIEISGSLAPKEDIMQAYKELHDMAKALFLSQNPMDEEMRGTITRTIEEVDTRPLIEQINTCTDIELLGSYKLLVRGDDELNNAFRKKLIELSNPK